MKRFLGSRLFIACVAATITAFVVGGVAWAVQSPVDGNGVVHACYGASNGNLHLNVTGGACPRTGQNTPITWNVRGPAGPQGAPGVNDVHVLRVTVLTGDQGASVIFSGAPICSGGPTSPGCNPVFADGVSVGVRAIPFVLPDITPTGAVFDHWTGACSGTNPDDCFITMDASKAVGAVFVDSPS